jgi:hypothetical protein
MSSPFSRRRRSTAEPTVPYPRRATGTSMDAIGLGCLPALYQAEDECADFSSRPSTKTRAATARSTDSSHFYDLVTVCYL